MEESLLFRDNTFNLFARLNFLIYWVSSASLWIFIDIDNALEEVPRPPKRFVGESYWDFDHDHDL